MAGAFGPVPGGSTILMQTVGTMVMYADPKGKIWRYLYAYDQRWPVEFIPEIDLRRHGHDTKKADIGDVGLTQKEIEDLV